MWTTMGIALRIIVTSFRSAPLVWLFSNFMVDGRPSVISTANSRPR